MLVVDRNIRDLESNRLYERSDRDASLGSADRLSLGRYSLFSEQYLERPPATSRWVSLSATICTWRGIPTIDDPDMD